MNESFNVLLVIVTSLAIGSWVIFEIASNKKTPTDQESKPAPKTKKTKKKK